MEFKSAEQAVQAIRRDNNMQTQLEQEKEKLRRLQLEADEEVAITTWLRTTGINVEPCDANVAAIKKYFHGDSMDIDEGDQIDVQGLEIMMQDFQQREMQPLAFRTGHGEWKKREAAIKELLSLFRDRNPQFLEVERKKLEYTPTDEIIQMVQNAREGRRLQALSVEQLKAERALQKPAAAKIVLDSKFSRAVILAMAPGQIRLLASSLDAKSGREGFGMELITARINGWS